MAKRNLKRGQHKEEFGFLKKVAAVILAGGRGTRLFPLTAHRCKPAVSFGGRYRLIDIPLSNALNSRINQIYVISPSFDSQLHQHILTTNNSDMFRTGGLELRTPQETTRGKEWFKGTADAVRQNLEYLLKSSAEYFLILSGDQLYTMDLLDMLKFAEQEDSDLVIATILVGKREAKRMGLIQIDKKQSITDFYEKPQEEAILKKFSLPTKSKSDPERYLASMGIYIFKREALIKLLDEEGDDFGRDLIPKCLNMGKCSSYIYEGYWEDIGTVSSYYQANLLLTEGKGLNTYQEDYQIYARSHHVPSALINGTRISNSLISQGSIIDAEEITHSIVGVRALIKQGTIIQDSIILGNRTYHPFLNQALPSDQYFSIGENCLIQKTIVDEEARIGDNVQLINKDGLETYDGDGIYIRDGIIIVTSGTEPPDNFIL
ncbi:MAG: Glucose-1-phosphate adenylyltransferase [Chlamydiae bacterium]|nr:Glucose-1-phosphate adenylyltransferase [Chlamydiota bacterium]